MRKIILLFVVFAVCVSNKPSSTTKIYELDWAIAHKIINCEFRGNNESPHYYQPIVANITNLTNTPIQIRIANGLTFKASSEGRQDVVITQEELIAIASHKNIEKPLFGMCIEKYNKAPRVEEIYTPSSMASKNLNLLTKEIEKQKYYDTAGQNAVWNLTDNGTLADIAGYDIEAGAPLRNFMAKLLGIPEDQIPVFPALEETLITRTVGGKFKYKCLKTSAITIGMFNDDDIIVKELYNNPETPAGVHKLAYEFDTLVYPDDVYYIRLIIDGQIKINFKMKAIRS